MYCTVLHALGSWGSEQTPSYNMTETIFTESFYFSTVYSRPFSEYLEGSNKVTSSPTKSTSTKKKKQNVISHLNLNGNEHRKHETYIDTIITRGPPVCMCMCVFVCLCVTIILMHFYFLSSCCSPVI